MDNDKKESSRVTMMELCDLPEARIDEIAKAFKHARIDFDTWEATVKGTIKNAKITTMNEGLYLGWIFSQSYERCERRGMREVSKRLSDLLR